MKKVILFAMALAMTGLVAEAKAHNCGSKDANHKCTGNCKNHKKDLKATKTHNCGSKDANHKCKGECKDHKQVKSVKK